MAHCKYFCKQVPLTDQPSADWHFEYTYENLYNPAQWEVALQSVWISSKENKEAIDAIGLPLTLHCSNSWHCHRTAIGEIERKYHTLGQIHIQDLPKGGGNKKGDKLFAKSDFQEAPHLTCLGTISSKFAPQSTFNEAVCPVRQDRYIVFFTFSETW